MKSNKALTVRVILTETLLLAGLVWLLTINRTDWIIRFGILVAERYIQLTRVAWVVLAIALNVGILIGALQRKKREAAQPIKVTFAPDKVLSPQDIRTELTRFQAGRPQLNELLQQGLDQLDNIDRKKEKMGELIARNDVALLSQASDALTSAEQTLCRKLVLVLNRALLCDPDEENPRRREAVYAEHARAMQVFLTENEEVLNRCETLLTETVRYVEEKKAGRENMDLQVMTDVIRSLANDGIRMDTH